MDPNKALKDFLEACVEFTCTDGAPHAREEGLEALNNLRDWIMRGGFFPNAVVYDSQEEHYRLSDRF